MFCHFFAKNIPDFNADIFDTFRAVFLPPLDEERMRMTIETQEQIREKKGSRLVVSSGGDQTYAQVV
jgi:hypothetical protein